MSNTRSSTWLLALAAIATVVAFTCGSLAIARSHRPGTTRRRGRGELAGLNRPAGQRGRDGRHECL